jgi:NADH-quinone oxidoreductase subunit A
MSEMIVISIIISTLLLSGCYFLNKNTYKEKLSQYECGFEPLEEKPGITEPGERFYIKYYIIGIIFLIFDLEAILLYPYTTLLSLNNPLELSNWLTSYLVFLIFMVVLILGLIYEYIKGVLD